MEMLTVLQIASAILQIAAGCVQLANNIHERINQAAD